MIEKSNKNIDASLWNAYSESFFRFEAEWRVSNYAVITAWNPYSNLRSKEENSINNHALEKQLQHVNYAPVTVGDSAFTWYEESFAVELSPEVAVELASDFQQNAIYYVINDQLYLIACSQPKVFHTLGSLKPRLV
ncbi:Protein of uncharacterised function (DUF3293) [Vibrio alginolyticus]|uniref:DUF3293 domain-containing protein n=2 Tax=Vibrio alginolyticus TaxID=663 RepID=A0ABX4XC18_VIBAL|nr:DUF3293 domain-containing protein [Vibrio alginolyticus]AGV18456.1 hypothetical protein N646_2644 [Vibrio alginolyticus NBRC 15630 = ATCC 17749]AVF71604.1 DUF3293 domain-containing protein [Vibrio alginolyticus]MBY7679476.1 DUF3293 domain-containing protein [Vibrio alginolyticus]MCS0036542.1 DUF3293 domain-containing protein [Vibrio alginolyticus]PNP25923.1 DUF3293 domain-containing protein [Vibrio alginolyticus]